MSKKNNFVDVVSVVPLVGPIAAYIVKSILGNPVTISIIAASLYYLHGYATLDGMRFLKSLVGNSDKLTLVTTCILNEKSLLPEKIIPCSEPKDDGYQTKKPKPKTPPKDEEDTKPQDEKGDETSDGIMDSLMKYFS